MRSLERHFHLRVRGADLILEVDGDTARMGQVVHGDVPATDQIDAGAIAEVYNALRALCGPDWRPTEIQLAREIVRLENERGDNFPAQVRAVLRASLATGEVSARNISALLSMHERTLARRLDAFGTGLRDLLNEARHDAARQMLEDTSLDIGRIAELLGYSRASVFTRAFRAWSGTTPTAWRKERTGAARRRPLSTSSRPGE